MWNDLKSFILRGNILDLAVGVIIGGAFGKIVSSLVEDLLMPLIGLLLGGVDFSELNVTVGEAVIAYGAFIQSVIDFLIIAVSIFFFIRFLNMFNKKKEEAPPAEPAPTKEEILLTEIRDLLKNR